MSEYGGERGRERESKRKQKKLHRPSTVTGPFFVPRAIRSSPSSATPGSSPSCLSPSGASIFYVFCAASALDRHPGGRAGANWRHEVGSSDLLSPLTSTPTTSSASSSPSPSPSPLSSPAPSSPRRPRATSPSRASAPRSRTSPRRSPRSSPSGSAPAPPWGSPSPQRSPGSRRICSPTRSAS